jgi:hypothetical protein
VFVHALNYHQDVVVMVAAGVIAVAEDDMGDEEVVSAFETNVLFKYNSHHSQAVDATVMTTVEVVDMIVATLVAWGADVVR